MTSIQFLLLAVGLYGLGALACLLFGAAGRTAKTVGAAFSLLGSVSGVISVVLILGEGATPSATIYELAPFGSLALQLDLLSALLLAIISLVGIATSLYSFSDAPANASNGFFTNLFMGAMTLVVTVTNAFFFLVFWELMTLASYFLVVWEFDKKEAARTGFIYLLIAHVGAALIMAAFLLFFGKTGTLDFEAIRSETFPPVVKNLVFLLAFFGFGAKAGMVPLHFWTPDTYAAAPSHASALMASVMKKTAVYGILRICVDLAGGDVAWWGFTVLTFGALSVLIGAFYALTERDIKRLLAFSSVENVGIILMGIGMGMLGLASQQPVLAVLGFLAAMYHMLNHAFFKGLLFLGAGAVIAQTGTHDLNKMGGLGRRMPWTALAFLAGALAVTAIPPLNGFVSEWFTYQALLAAGSSVFLAARVCAPLFAAILALAGAFALMVYVKAYSGAFSGPAQSESAKSAVEAPAPVLVSLVYLSLGSLALGLGAPWIAPFFASVAANLANQPVMTVQSGWAISSGESISILSSPLIAILILAFLTVPVMIITLYGGWRASKRQNVDPWSCGYGYQAPMAVRASNFDQPVRVSFHPLYWLRTLVKKPYQAIHTFYLAALDEIRRAEPVVENLVTRPTLKFVETAGQWIQTLQMGDIRLYCLYIIITLAILLIVLFGRSGL